MNVLVVDDIENNRLILSRFLSGKGYEVLQAASGSESIEVIKKHDVDLILMDIKMPDMDGYEAAKKIKSIRAEEYIPIIFVSALSEEEALEEALASGGDDYVSKPVSFGTLYSKIKAHARIRGLHSKVNSQNKELNLHNSRLEREHQLISHFFDQAKENCYVNDRVVKFVTMSMETFNGDTVLVGRRSNGGVTILVGDFTGHGLSAAVGTLPVSQIFYKMVEKNAFVGDIAREINKQINILLPVEMFFAASLIELSANGDRLMVWHGGMPDAYLYDRANRDLKIIQSQHLPLGVREEKDFDDSIQLFYVNEDFKLIVLTDGLTEATNSKNEMIDTKLFEKVISSSSSPLSSIVDCYKKYSKNMPQSDDISILELSCVAVERDSKVSNEDLYNSTVPWAIELVSENEELGKDVVQNVMDLIGHSVALKESKGVVHTLLTEMFTNAVDHGILGLDGEEKHSSEAFDQFYVERENLIQELKETYVKINVDYQYNEKSPLIKVAISHNGKGFDPGESNAGDDALHGRGMLLIDAICNEVDYSDNGRCLTVSMEL